MNIIPPLLAFQPSLRILSGFYDLMFTLEQYHGVFQPSLRILSGFYICA